MIETFGGRLRRLRETEKLSQTQVANLIGVTKTTVCYYETDRRQPPLGTLVHLAHVFGVTSDYLLGIEKVRPINMSKLTAKDLSVIAYLVERMSEANQVKGASEEAKKIGEQWDETL